MVKMSFHPHLAKDFLNLFEEKKERIANFKGCTHLELLRDTNAQSSYMTYSHWESEEALNNYRKSDFFSETWIATKKLFDAKPEAVSWKRV